MVMKKLLLFSIIFFPEITKPITASQAVCSVAIASSISSATYSYYQWYKLNTKKNALTTQLKNINTPEAERTKIVAELKAVKTLMARYENIMIASGVVFMGSYIFFPNGPKYNGKNSPNQPTDHNITRVLNELTAEQLNAIDRAITQDMQDVAAWNNQRPNREIDRQYITAQEQRVLARSLQQLELIKRTRTEQNTHTRRTITLTRLNGARGLIEPERQRLQNRQRILENDLNAQVARPQARLATMAPNDPDRPALEQRIQTAQARIQAALARIPNDLATLNGINVLINNQNAQQQIARMTDEQINTLHTQLNDLEAEPADPLQECLCGESTLQTHYIQLACGHQHCPNCLEQLVINAIREQTTIALLCPDTTCANRPLTDQDIRTITNGDASAMARVGEIKTRVALGTDPNFKQCPTPDCQHVFINEPNNTQEMRCPECQRSYCPTCLIKHPGSITCTQAAIIQPHRQAIREHRVHRNNEAETNRITRQCPGCQQRIFRYDGCNHIRCGNCQHYFCWVCLGNGNRCSLFNCYGRPVQQ